MTIDKLAWLTFSGRRVLCARSRGKELFYLPGGKREPGESDAEALVREIDEELGVALDPSSLRLEGVFVAPADGKSASDVKMTCYYGNFRGELAPLAEIEELAWMGAADRSRCSAVVRDVLDVLVAKGLVE